MIIYFKSITSAFTQPSNAQCEHSENKYIIYYVRMWMFVWKFTTRSYKLDKNKIYQGIVIAKYS